MRPRLITAALAAVAALFALAGGGCSAILDFDDECANTAQCKAGLACYQGLCVDPTTVPGGLPDVQAPADSVADTASDVAADGGPDGSTDVTSDVPADVATDLPPEVVIVPQDLLVAPCDLVYGVPLEEALDDDVILLGTLLPKSGELAALGPPIRQAVELAIDEINQAGGLFGKRLAILSCDSGTSVTQSVTGAHHLIDVGKVPAIIGAAASTATIGVFNDAAKPANVLVMSPASTSPAITDLPDNDLLWRTVPTDAIQGEAIGNYLLDAGFGKIAVINRDDAYGNGLRDAISSTICVTHACTDEDAYFVRSYSETAFASDQSAIVLDLVGFAPDIIVLIAFPDDGISFVEQAVTKGMTRYVVPDGLRSASLITEISSNEALCRMFGTNPASPTGDAYLSFELRFKSKYGAAPGTYSANAYDAAYLLAYAMVAAGLEDLDGPAIAAGLRRLSAGTEVVAGSSALGSTIQHLAASSEATINFTGTSGALDFDAQGEAPSSIEGWEFDLDKNKVVSLGILFDADGYYSPTLGSAGGGQVCLALEQESADR